MKPTDAPAYPPVDASANGNSAAAERPAGEAPVADRPHPATGAAAVPAPPPRRQRSPRLRPIAWAFGVLAVLVAIVGLVAGRLAAGPVSLTWAIPLILPLIDDRLDALTLAAGKAELDWQDWRTGPTVRVAGLAATGPGFALTADGLSAGIGADQLLGGRLVPDRIAGRGLELVLPLPTPPAGEAATATADATLGAESAGLFAMLVDPAGDGPLAGIDSVEIADARVTLVDGTAGPVWHGRVVHAQLNRGGGGLTGKADIAFDQGGRPGSATLSLDATAAASAGARLDFANVELAALAPLADTLLPLTALALPLSGTLTTTLDAAGRPGRFDLDASGGPGALVISPLLARRLDLPVTAAQQVAIERLTLKGSGDPTTPTWTVREFSLIGADAATVAVPAPVERRVPFRRLDAAFVLSPASLVVDTLALDIGGPRFAFTGTVADPFGAAGGRLEGRIDGTPIAAVIAYWPRQLGVDAYDWVSQHLAGGRIDGGRLALTLAPAGGTTTVAELALSLPVEDAVVNYLPPLPPVEAASVLVEVTLDTLRATVSRGRVGGLAVSDGNIVIPDLAADVPSIDIAFRAAGPAAAVVGLLATPPLDYVDRQTLDPGRVGGSVDARIRLSFPLLDDLDVDAMRIGIEGTGSRLAIAGLPGNLAIGDANIRFAITEQGLQARGPLVVAGIAGRLDWEEDFQAATPLRTDIVFETARAAVSDVRHAVAPWVDLGRYLTGGSLAGRLRFTLGDDGDAAVDGRFDLTQAALAVPELRWVKPAGKAAALEAEATIANGRLDAVRRLGFMASDADILGRALFDADGSLNNVHVERFRLGRTQLAGDLRAIAGDDGRRGWSITVNGKALDAEPFLGDAEADVADRRTGSATPTDLANLFISADIDTAWLGSEAPAKRILVTVTREGGVWRLVQVKGETDAGQPFSLDVLTTDGVGRLTVRAADAGGTLAALGLLTTLRGGVLRGDGRIDSDGNGGMRVKGELRINDFRLVQAPLLARLLEVLALTGLRDVLTGRGMFFSAARLPFEQAGGVIEIGEARAAGPSLGLTASGAIDLEGETINLRGTVVPFYWANSLIGSLPLIGNWLVGGQPGGGLFSATFRATGSLDDPTLAVNPFSIVLPSVVRMLLELIQGWAAPAGNNNQP